MAVINLVLAVGLSVDYAAHVGHSFMLKTGTRDERMVKVCVCILCLSLFFVDISDIVVFVIVFVLKNVCSRSIVCACVPLDNGHFCCYPLYY